MVEVSANLVKEQDVSIDSEKLLDLGALRLKESICKVCLRVKLSRQQQNEVMIKREKIFRKFLVRLA